MQRLGTCLCVLASALCCSSQGSGGGQGHGALRFTVTVGTLRTFDDARAFCGTDRYLLNLHAAVNASHVQATLLQNGLGSSYVWLNLRMIQGFFHWLDPIPQLFKQTFSLPYGNAIAFHNYHHGCAVLNTSSGAIETRPCDEQYPFVCIEDKQLRPLDVSGESVSVELTSNQPPVLLSWNLPYLRLTCRTKLRNGTVIREAVPGKYAYTHVWTKNGVFLDHTYLSLQPEKVSEPNVYTHNNMSSQGRYRCGLKALPSGSIAWSNVVTVVLEDFDTYRLTGHLFQTVDPGPIQFIGGSFVSFARSIEAALSVQQVSDNWSYSGITTDDANRVSISIFLYYKRPELAAFADANERKRNVLNDSTALEHLVAINNITDVLHCNFLQQGVFTFHTEGHVGLVESMPPCLTESDHLVPRYCDMNFVSEPTWAPFDESTCKAGTLSQAFDIHLDAHSLLCTPRYCLQQPVFGAWSEVRELCNSWRGYLASNGPGWTDIVKKHGYLQSDSAGHPQVLEALKTSELLVPIILPHGANATSCFLEYSGNVTQTSCSDERGGKCAFRYRSFFRALNPCPKGGWLDLSSKNTCLWLNLSPLDYERAAEKCRASNGHLAFVDNSSLSYTLALLLAPNDVPRQFDRYWIGLQRSPDGVYVWENGDPLREFAWHPRTDYKHSAGTLFVDRYSVRLGLTLRYSLEDPRRKLPSICQAPLQTGTPWLRVEQRNAGSRVLLTCRVSAEIIPGSVLWYKDGIAVQGDRASTPDGHDTTLVIEGATPSNPYLQGYYWCEGMSVADFGPVESRKTLVRFPGIKTYACTIPLVGKNPELYDFNSVLALRFASDFRRDFFYAIRDTIVEGYHLYELQVIDIAQDTATADIVRFLVFFNRLRRLPRMTSQDEEVRIIDFLEYTLRNSTFRLVTNLSVLPEAMSIRSTEMCFEDTTMHDTGLQKELTWPATPTGGVAIPWETCIQGDGQPVVRRCEGSFTTGAYWGNVQGACERLASDTTLNLRNLSLEVVTNATMVPTAERLRELTADSGSLGAQDVLYVATTLENIVSAGAIEVQTATEIASTISHVFKADSQALQQSRSGNSTNRILAAIEDASAGLSSVTVVISGSVALGKVDSAEAARGIAIHLRDNSKYNFNDPENLTRGTDVAFMLSEANASVPRLAIALMQDSALFQEMAPRDNESEVDGNDGNAAAAYEVCTSVLQVKYDTDDGAARSTSNDARFSFYFRQACDIVPDEIECVFWDVNENDRFGSWSGDGCEYLGNAHGYHQCNCTHLTSFAVLFKYDKSRSGRNVHDAILSYLTLIGVAVSGLGLFMVVLTYIFFKKWRKGVGHQILFNLCLALVGALASFVAMATLPKHRASLVSCTCVGAALHYFLLVSFAWTFVESLLQYLRFVRVLGAYVPNLVLKAAFGAWGAPMLVILCVLIVNPTQYHKRKDFCWLEAEALLYSFLLPVGLILAANVMVFGVVVFSIYCRRQKGLRSTQSQVELAKAQLRATICIVFLLGLTWIFAYLSLIEAASKEWGRLFEYLFVITSSLQGLVIFIFHIAYEKTAREFWLGHIVYRIWPYNRKMSFDHHGSSKATLSSSAQKTTST